MTRLAAPEDRWTLDIDGAHGRWSALFGGESVIERARVGLFRRHYRNAEEVRMDLAQAGLAPGQRALAFDFWRRELRGTVAGEFRDRLEPRSCRVLFLHRPSGVPQFVGSDRHVAGAFAYEAISWDAKAQLPRGATSVPRGEPVGLHFHLPTLMAIAESRGGQAKLLSGNCIRLIVCGTGKAAPWRVGFAPNAVAR